MRLFIISCCDLMIYLKGQDTKTEKRKSTETALSSKIHKNHWSTFDSLQLKLQMLSVLQETSWWWTRFVTFLFHPRSLLIIKAHDHTQTHTAIPVI